MYVIQTLNSDVTIRPLSNKNSGVQNHETAQRLDTCGMCLNGYGSKAPKKLGQKIKICAPGHVLEHFQGTVIRTSSDRVFCEVRKNGHTYRNWFTTREVREV